MLNQARNTVDRSALRGAQTPQGFSRVVLMAAHQAAELDGAGPATDDAGLVERMGGPVVLVPGSEEAFKVTRPIDLLLAEALLAERALLANRSEPAERGGR